MNAGRMVGTLTGGGDTKTPPFPVADLRGGAPGTCPPTTAQNFRNFMQFFGNFWQNHRLALPHGGLAPPPTGNPGSAPATRFNKIHLNHLHAQVVRMLKYCSCIRLYRQSRSRLRTFNSKCECQTACEIIYWKNLKHWKKIWNIFLSFFQLKTTWQQEVPLHMCKKGEFSPRFPRVFFVLWNNKNAKYEHQIKHRNYIDWLAPNRTETETVDRFLVHCINLATLPVMWYVL